MAVIYVVFCAAVYFRPQLFFYNPVHRNSNLEVARKNGYPAEQVEYAAADGTKLLAWYTKPHTGRPVIVFMHGNSYNVEKFYHKMIPLMEAGYGTFMPEYRGFGNVPGVITQQNLGTDALAAVKYLHSLGYQNRDIVSGVLYGNEYRLCLGAGRAVCRADSGSSFRQPLQCGQDDCSGAAAV